MNQLGRWWEFLTRPSPKITTLENQRRARLLAGIALVVATVGLILLTIVLLFFIPDEITRPGLDTLAVWVGILLTYGIYFYNRVTGDVNRAAGALIALMIVVFVLPSFGEGNRDTVIYYAIVPILLAGIFFGIRAVVGVLVVVVGLGAGLNLITDYASDERINEALQFILFTGGIVIVFMNHLHALARIRRAHLEATNAQLRESEAMLEKRVEERTAALHVALQNAEEANRVKSMFLAAMSHELRTPLNGILNFTEFVAEGYYGEVNAKQKEALHDVLGNSRHLLALINDVLDISKIESGGLHLMVEDNVSLKEELTAALKASAAYLKGKSVRLDTVIAEDVPLLRGDRRRIRQILLNILSNACKFTEEGFIKTTVARQNGEVIVSIQDTGPGIAPKDHANVFETFKQTESGIRQGSGTGLGMPISRRLAEAHGGRLWLESDKGQGATFFLALPIDSPLKSTGIAVPKPVRRGVTV